MSWSTDLFCNISFNRKTYNSLDDVDSNIEELKNCLNTCKQEIRDIAMMTEYSKFYNPEDYDSPYAFVSETIDTNLGLIEEYVSELTDLYKLRDNWEKCHENELAINPPDNIHWDSAFLDGDFVKSVKHPNGYE